MKIRVIAILLLLGVIFWIVGTVYYRFRGASIFGSLGTRYWVNFFLVPVLSTVACAVLLRWLAIRGQDWSTAMLLLALPGLFGEGWALFDHKTFLPGVTAASAGKYASFLFVTYAFILAVAEVVTLRSTR